MVEEAPDAMNLDLNLGPGPGPGAESEAVASGVNLDDWMNDDPLERIREAVRVRARQRWRWRQVDFTHERQSLSVELDQLIGDSGRLSSGLQAGEGSVAAEERANEDPKMCDNTNGFLDNQVPEQDDVQKGSGTLGSFYDCNICFDLASDPVVTCCGHLFCWACLYRWLHVHSDAKECPVCKGEVTIKNVTPIYGRGTNNSRPPEEDSSLEIPNRPQGRRVESLRQTIQRNHFSFPMEEVIRRLGSRLDMVRELTPSQYTSVGGHDLTDRGGLLNRIMTFRGMRAEQSSAANPSDVVDLTQSGTSSLEGGRARRLHSMLFRRSQPQAQRPSGHGSLASAFNTTERVVEYLRNNPLVRNQDQAVDDRDSFSSIAAVINSESQMDTAVEIDSMVSLSTSSSRRRNNDSSRAPDVDSGDSRAPRRRRLN